VEGSVRLALEWFDLYEQFTQPVFPNRPDYKQHLSISQRPVAGEHVRRRSRRDDMSKKVRRASSPTILPSQRLTVPNKLGNKL
jgi:hypothetical protein